PSAWGGIDSRLRSPRHGGEAAELKHHPSTSPGRAPAFHWTTRSHGDHTHDGEAQTRSARGTVASGIGPVETIEDQLALAGGNTRTVVLDEKAHAIAGSDLYA